MQDEVFLWLPNQEKYRDNTKLVQTAQSAQIV